MASIRNVKAYAGVGNETSFLMVDDAGSPLDLTALVNAVVTVTVANPDGADWVITSAGTDVSFTGSVLTVKFGLLDIPVIGDEVKYYYPQITYVHDGNSEPILIVGKRYKTEIMLGAFS